MLGSFVTLGKLLNFFIQEMEIKKQTMPTVVGYQGKDYLTQQCAVLSRSVMSNSLRPHGL